MPRKSRFYPIDLNVQEGHEGYLTIMKCPSPIGMKDMNQIELKLRSSASSSGTTDTSTTANPSTTTSSPTIMGGSSLSSTSSPTLSVAQQAAIAAKRTKMAMSIAMNPGQALAMNAFMLYMSGSQLNVFSITTTSSAIMTPLTNIFSIERVFSQFNSNDPNNTVNVQIPKLIYIAINLAWLLIGLYKMSSMRLLPTTSADYTYKVVWKEYMEQTSIPPDHTFVF